MKFIYPVVLHKKAEGGYHAYFPDLESAEADADTIDEVLDLANEAAYNWIALELDEDDCQLPRVSDPEDIPLEEGDCIRNVCVTMRFYEGWDE